jgi:serine/threonine-protein kinase
MSLQAGTRLGPYEIVAVLGSGGMGDVYTALDTRLDRIVAIKVLRRRSDIDVTQHALGEARAAARVNHPRIASLYDVVEGLTADGAPLPPFLVMEYVDGRPLSKIIAAGPLDVDRALGIAIQIAEALDAAHRAGIIHRDVKPANIMLTRDDAVKVLDLGIAHSLMSGGTVTTATSIQIPVAPPDSGGTPAYMSPEQYGGRTPDARSDVFAAGIVLFEMLTGRRPFDAPDLATLAMLMTTMPVPPPSSVNAAVPAALDTVVANATAVNPEYRIASAAQLRDALAAVRAGDTVPNLRPAPARRRAVPIVAATAVALVAIAWALWTFRGVPRPRAPVAILPAVTAGDTVVEALGAGMVSTLADNLAAAPGLTVVSGARLAPAFLVPSRDLSKAARELGAGYVVDLRIAGTVSQLRVDGALIERGADAPIWRRSFTGNPVEVTQSVADAIAGTLEDIGILSRRPTREERERMRRVPTKDAAAFVAYATGQIQLETGDRDRDVSGAITSFSAALARDPSFALASAALSEAYGRMYIYTRDPEWAARAKDEAGRALAKDPSSARVHLSLGRAYQRNGRLEDALRHAQFAAQFSPTSDDAHRLLGDVLSDRGDVARAIEELQRAIDLRPGYWQNHAALGFANFRAGRYKPAIAAYRRAVDLEPSASNYQRLGTALHLSGNVQEAIGNYQHAVQLARDPLAYSNLAFSYYSAGRYGEALAAWQESARLSKNPTPTVLRNLGDVYERLKQPAKSRESYEAAIAAAEPLLKVNPSDANLIALVAVCMAKLGRHPEAALRAAEALSLRPDDNNVLFKVAVVEALGGGTERAFAHLENALARGYPAAFAKADFDLAALQTDPRFAALIAQHAQQEN